MRRFASWISASTRSSPLESSVEPLLERGGGELRRDLARLRAAHPVGDGEERRRDDVVVLVPAPPAPRVARDCVRADRPRLLLLDAEVGLADAEDVARAHPLGADDARAVDERAVRRVEVLHPDAVAARLDPRVAGGRELVPVEDEVVLAAAADGDRGGVDGEHRAGLEARAALHDEVHGPALRAAAADPSPAAAAALGVRIMLSAAGRGRRARPRSTFGSFPAVRMTRQTNR